METLTLLCKVVAKKNDILGYQTIVFKNLDPAPFNYRYIMTVVFPNWEGYIPNLDDEGFLTYDSVNGGSDEYYDRYEESFKKYNFILVPGYFFIYSF